MRALDLGDILRRTGRHDLAAAAAALGAEVDDPVRAFDDIEVVLDDHDRVAGIAQAVEHLEQLRDIVEVQARRRLVEDVERAPGVALAELLRELHALRLAAGQRGRVLAELDVAQAHIHQRLELARKRRHRLEEGQRVLDGHVEHFVDAATLVADLQRLAVVAAALAGVAGHVDIGQEVHLDLDHAIAFAGLAAAALDVEAEASGLVAARARLRHLREQLADRREQAGVGRRVAARRATDRALVDVDDLVEMLETFDAVAGRVARAGVVEQARGIAEQRVVDQRRLAGAGHAGHAGHDADRDLGRDVAQIVAARIAQHDLLLRVDRRALLRHRDGLRAREIAAGQRGRIGHDLRRRALRDDVAAVHAGAGADVDDIVGLADRVLVMLDDDDRIAEIAQVHERLQQALVVALVQADRGLVEHVEHADQTGADLRSQADALRLAAGQGFGAARKREVVEADVVQEAEARADLLEDLLGDLALVAGQLHLREEGLGIAHRLRDDLRQAALGDVDMARGAVQALAFAGRAGLVRQILRQLLAHRDRFGLLVAALEVRQHAFELVHARDDAAALVRILEGDLLLAAAVEHGIARLLAELRERLLGIELVVLGERGHQRPVVRIAPVPAADRAFGEARVRMRDHALRVEHLQHAEAIAARAGARGRVEREQARFQVFERIAAVRAGHARRKRDVGGRVRAVVRRHEGEAVGQAQRGLEGFGHALLDVRSDLEAIDDDLDVVLELAVQHRHFVELVDLAVDARAHEALRAHLLEPFRMLALAASDHRREQHPGRFGRQREHVVDHLRDALRLELHVAVIGAVGGADARVEQAQVVVDLGDRADRRARVVRGRLLLDRDRRRQAFDRVDIRLLHHRQELARIRRQRLDVAALAFGVQRVEGEAGLAGAGQTGDDDQLVARKLERDVLEVVGARAADPDRVHREQWERGNRLL